MGISFRKRWNEVTILDGPSNSEYFFVLSNRVIDLLQSD